MLRFDDALPITPQRVLVAGTTGVGKSTLARRLSDLWGLPYTELDSLYHGPGWTPRPEFTADLTALAAGDTWITEWQYWNLGVGPVLGERAQVVAWLDLPRRVALSRLLRRTVARRIRGDELWNGNTEPPLHTFFTRPEDNIVRWEMRTHATWRQRIPEVRDRYPRLHIVRLRNSKEVEAWLGGPATAVASFVSD